MTAEKNISGISDNLSESISEHKTDKEIVVGDSILKGQKVAISVSESEELEHLGLSEQHLKDISIEIARYLIVNGAKMIYGGDLRDGGFTRLFSELSFQYKHLSDRQIRFTNYFPFPNSNNVSLKDKADFIKNQIEAKILEIPEHLGKIDIGKKYEPFKNIEDRYIFSECFANMRLIMANESDTRILIGGKQKNYLGYIPGIIEEAYYSLKAGKSLFLVGGFGGATKTLIEVIQGKRPKEFTNEFQFDSEFLIQFQAFCKGRSVSYLDFDFLFDFFNGYNIEMIAKSNGLSVEENFILFESTNIHEIVFLIVKGLKNISNKK